MPLAFLFRAVRRPALTSNFSFSYLCFFLPLALIGYTVCPKKWKKWMLLLISYGFFFLISGSMVLYLMGSTLTVYGLGLWLDRLNKRCKAACKEAEKEQRKAIKKQYATYQHWVTFLGVAVNIGLLLWLKYSGFFAENVNVVLRLLHLDFQLAIPHYIMPIGISFYSLQALSYLLDISRGAITADRNIGRVALFVSFFPQIVEGPICRYGDTAQQLWEAQPIRFENLKLGCQRIAYGMMKKMVVADRLNGFVGVVFSEYGNLSGGMIALGAIAYTAQLYMDFSGAMDCVCGVAQILGIAMPENFRAPFFSHTISEFWSRWHITLGTWFRDFIFYPVTMSRRMKNLTTSARKKLGNHFGPLIAGSIALFCVWFCNGLWHGSAWSYIFFGMYHFVLILIGNAGAPYFAAIREKLHIGTDCRPFGYFQQLRTACLVVIGELFFRAETLTDGMRMFGRMVSGASAGVLPDLKIDRQDVIIVLVTLGIVFAVSLLKEKGISIRRSLAGKPAAVRWAVWYGLILFIILFGAYGLGYTPVDPMYANF